METSRKRRGRLVLHQTVTKIFLEQNEQAEQKISRNWKSVKRISKIVHNGKKRYDNMYGIKAE